jgi:hypothetical protein
MPKKIPPKKERNEKKTYQPHAPPTMYPKRSLISTGFFQRVIIIKASHFGLLGLQALLDIWKAH